MKKIQLENNEGWFDLDEVSDKLNVCSQEDDRITKFVIYKTKNGNLITMTYGRMFGKYLYKKSTQEEIDLYNNRYIFPEGEEI